MGERSRGEPMVPGKIRTDTKFPSSVGMVCGATKQLHYNIKRSLIVVHHNEELEIL